MKKKLKIELYSKQTAELTAEDQKRRLEISQIQIDVRLGKIKNTSLLKVKKDELAVIQTILTAKKLKGEK